MYKSQFYVTLKIFCSKFLFFASLERAWRVQQRDMMRGVDVDFSSDEDDQRINTGSKRVQKHIPSDVNNDESSEEESSDNDGDDDASQSESENEQSEKQHSSNSESEDSNSEKEYNNSAAGKKAYTSNGSSVSQSHIQESNFGRASVIHKSYEWNVQGNSKGQKIHILQYAYDGSPSNK